MATKTKEPAALMELPVAFGNLSVGDKTCRIGITVDRGSLSVSQADKKLCERRLVGKIVSRPSGDAPGQGALEGMEFDTEIKGIFDVKGFSVSKDQISLGLTFAIASVNVESLTHFANRMYV